MNFFKLNNYFFIVSIFMITTISAQEKIEYEKSITPLIAAETFEREGEFEKALEQYNKVYEGDSLFFSYTLYKKMACLLQLERYEDVKKVGDKYWYFRHDLPTEFYLSYGTALDKLEEYDAAQKMYQTILEEFPINHSLWYNYGISLSLSGNDQEAYEVFKKTVEINPFYDRVHLALANIAVNEKQTSKALMALGMYMWLSADKRNNLSQLRYGNFLASSKYWTEEEFKGSQNVDLGNTSNYAPIDQLLHNYIGLQKKYKTPSKLNYAFINQCHIIFSQLKDIKADPDDFWYNTYSEFFGKLLDEKQFAGYSYLVSNYSEDPTTLKIVKSNKKAVIEFLSWGKMNLDEIKRKVNLDFIGFGKTTVTRNDKTKLIEALGDFEYDPSTSKFVGDLTFVSVNGRKSAIGTFNKNGNKEGEWKYFYPNGYLKEVATLVDGLSIDTSYTYQNNGLLQLEIPYKEGKIHGDVHFYRNGVLFRILPYTEGEMKEGQFREYHLIGSLDFNYTLKDGKSHGPFKSYFDSGELFREGVFQSGNLEGERITYFRNGGISVKENFVEDLNDGTYLSLFEDGQKESEGSFSAGNKIGEWVYYYENGNKRVVQNFDETGKENGVEESYTKNGWKLAERTFNKGVVDSYVYYSENGQIISEGTRKGGELDYKGYFKNGNIKSEGKYNKKGRNGEWKYYDYNGTLSISRSYSDNLFTGDYKEYFVNGKVEIEYDFNEEGESEGYYQNFYRNGKLYKQGFLKNSSADGPWRSYHRNGNLYQEYFFSKTEQEGFENEYAINGKPTVSIYYAGGLKKFTIYYDTAGVAFDTVFQMPGKREIELSRCAECPPFMVVDVVNNKYHGKQVFTYPNGVKNADGEVFNGNKNGLWKTYHPNGKLASEGVYYFGDKNGVWKYYNIYGVISSEVNYKNGKKHGARTTYDEEGKVDFKTNFSYDDTHGEVTFYIGGKVDHTREYNYGYIESYTYTEKGKEVTKEVNNETADVEVFWDNGNLARKFKIERGWFQGPYKKYYENGKLESEQTYLNDRNEGEFKSYHPNGKLKVETNYMDGLIVGDYIEYYSTGKLKAQLSYYHDELEGWSYYYNEDGSLISKIFYINGNEILIEND